MLADPLLAPGGRPAADKAVISTLKLKSESRCFAQIHLFPIAGFDNRCAGVAPRLRDAFPADSLHFDAEIILFVLRHNGIHHHIGGGRKLFIPLLQWLLARGADHIAHQQARALLCRRLCAILRAKLIDGDGRLQRKIFADRQRCIEEGEAIMGVGNFAAAALQGDGL